ncbi:penicillin-binding protein activator, partial [bacterium]|nr:penicillin-binding protein activator [bacterium]
QNKQRLSAQIELVIRDSQSEVSKGLRETRSLIKRHGVRAIIGELESDITAAIGALASELSVPSVGPVASKNQVAAVGETVFQLNSDLERKGDALAQYAFNVLGFRTFATLAPADEYGQQLTDSFTAKIDELGGRIIAQSFYYGDPEDLSRQFKGIREAAFNYDSTDVEKLIEEAEELGEKLEEKDIPVLSIDAVFLPVYSDHIKYVAPHFAFSNIRAQILGGDEWHDFEILNEAQIEKYVNGAIFVSDFFADDEWSHYREYRDAFRVAMRRTPERWEAFGYDALSVLIEAVNSGAKTGDQITEKLNALSDFSGVKGPISFKGNHRVNKEVNFLQFLNGRIIRNPLNEETNGRQ